MEQKRFTVINDSFVCRVCQTEVLPLHKGCRNHCPHCLHSVHVDKFPGDRAANCEGIMIPVRIFMHSKKGYMVEHQCEHCGYRSVNKLALEDATQPDEMHTVLELVRKSAH
ncbi:MAG: RNHCP domain-containing protein [Acidibacillus sp.]|uniref:RNHCP domain-containing protein n=1 Tax=Sulfoacidibacillus ferrooxidans TaxID=2005001 RepID=UPI001F50ACC2|nr:RNHCP domain-containing protein [Acidibacillus sp.]